MKKYYCLDKKYEKKINNIQKDVDLTLKFFDGEDKCIIKAIIDRKGKTTQSEIFKDTDKFLNKHIEKI